MREGWRMIGALAFLRANWLPIGLVALLAGALLTAGVERSRRLQVVAEYATATAERERENAREFARLIDNANALQSRLNAIDAQGSTELRKVKDENDSLRLRVAAGGGLRVPAVCVPSPTTGATPDSSRVDFGGTAVLTTDAGQRYLDARENVGETEVKLRACQSALREILAK